MAADQAAPHPPAGAVRRPIPLEWWFYAAFTAVGIWVFCATPVHWAAADFQLYHKLAGAFAAGNLACLATAYGLGLLRGFPPAARRAWRAAAAAVAGAIALAAFTLVQAPDSVAILRLLEALALGTTLTATLLTLFLPAAGYVTLRELGRLAAETVRFWLPLLVYIVLGGYCLTAVRLATPRVWDPVLLRMDLSLGFNASVLIHGWRSALPWLYPLSDTTYPLLGLLIAAVPAAMQIAGARAHARRAVTALFLVGALGIACYWIFPAVGPIYAFGPLFQPPDTAANLAAAHDTLRAALHGAARIAGPPELERNVMPSLHVAFTLVALAAAWSWRRRFFWLCLPVAFFLFLTPLTLTVHYLVDLFAAVPFAALCWWIADRAVRATPHPRDEPLPALATGGAALAVSNHRLGLTLAASLAALVAWGWFAPLTPWIAWPLAAVVAAVPAWAALRAGHQTRPFVTPAMPAPPRPAPADWRVRLLAAAVFCSGGIALVLEQIYEKYLSTLVGASRPAATIVLAVYFAGLALGAWLCPKQTAGAPRRLAALELFIAAWAVLVGAAFFACGRLLGGWLAGVGNGPGLAAMRAALAALWILPPTLAMGAELPVLAAVLAGHPLWRGRNITHYYALNLAGAFAFTVATPPLLFATIGAGGALWAVAALGLAVGLALWFGLPPATETPAGADARPATAGAAAPRGWTLAAGAAGFGFFALEIVWFHLISAVCGASVYGFTLLLAVVLLGLFIGGWASARGPSALAPVLGWLIVALAAGDAAWPWAGRFMARVQGTQQFTWFWAGEFLKFCTVALIVLPAAALAGRIFPWLLRDAGGSRAVGRLCAANVLGCIAGALVTGFVLIPAVGSEHALQGLVLLAASGWLALALRRPFRAAWLAPGVAGLALLLLLPRWNRLELTRGFGVYLAPVWPEDARLKFFREDFASGFVTVISYPAAARSAPVKALLQNGKFDADNADEMPAQIGFALVAALHASAQGRALVIGCGSGQTASVIARLGFKHVDIAELSPAHLAAARAEFSAINARVLDRPNVAVHVEDGRNFLLRTTARYDLIQIEVTSIWFAGATNLYSREFYALARRRLAPGGVLAQWVQLHHITPRELASVFATARAEFPFVSIWRVAGQACLLASDRPPRLNERIWELWDFAPDLLDERLITGLVTPGAFAATELLDPAQLRALLARHGPAVINTDRNRWLEFQTPKYYLDRRDLPAENLRWITGQTNPSGVLPPP